MAASDFQNRWAKKTTHDAAAAPVSTPSAPAEPVAKSAPKETQPLPTLEDVARLSADSDYSAFVAKGVDENVKRSAMKKLFTDPHFNIMDRLDIYIDDYTKFDPIPPEMLALLEHAKSVLNPLKHLESPGMRMISRDDIKLAEQGDGAPEDVAALEETGEAVTEKSESSQLSETAVDEDSDTKADDAVKEPGADTSKPQAPDSAGTDEQDPGILPDRAEPTGLAGQHEHHTGADARPDAKS